MNTPCEEKKVYSSKVIAEAYSQAYAKKYGEEPLRAYKCDKCGHWHLTSKDGALHRQQVKATELKYNKMHSSWISRERNFWEDRLLTKDERRVAKIKRRKGQ